MIESRDEAVVVVRAELIGEVVRRRAGTVRQRIQCQVVARHHVDALVGDEVIREPLPRIGAARGGERIVDGAVELGEIAAAHLLGRHGVGRRFRLDVAQVLEGQHEEGVIAEDRTGQRSGDAVVLAGRLLRAGALGQQRRGAARIAAVEVRGSAFDVVRAGAEGEVHRRAGGVADRGVEGVRLHSVFGDGVGGGREADHAAVVARIGIVR